MCGERAVYARSHRLLRTPGLEAQSGTGAGKQASAAHYFAFAPQRAKQHSEISMMGFHRACRTPAAQLASFEVCHRNLILAFRDPNSVQSCPAIKVYQDHGPSELNLLYLTEH